MDEEKQFQLVRDLVKIHAEMECLCVDEELPGSLELVEAMDSIENLILDLDEAYTCSPDTTSMPGDCVDRHTYRWALWVQKCRKFYEIELKNLLPHDWFVPDSGVCRTIIASYRNRHNMFPHVGVRAVRAKYLDRRSGLVNPASRM